MSWVLEHLQLLIAAAAAIAYVLNRRRGESETAEPKAPSSNGPFSAEQAERTRRVQEEIRRKIAERRGGPAPASDAQRREVIPPLVRPSHVPPLDPFGGPMRRVIRKLEEPLRKAEAALDDSDAARRVAEIARQASMMEQLRQLERVRAEHERRATEIRSAKSKRKPAPIAAISSVVSSLRLSLRDPRELRRAIVQREILGPPVSLR